MEWRQDPREERRVGLHDDRGVTVAHVFRLNRPGGGQVWVGRIDSGPRREQETGPCDTLDEAQQAVVDLLGGRRRPWVRRDTRYKRSVGNAPIRVPHRGTLRRPPRR